MEKAFKWCFIGSGKLANTIAGEILPWGQHEIVSVYSRNFEKAKIFAEKCGAVAYEDPASAILAEDVQGVYVVTPHNAHYEYVKLALELGKPVLCEKAFTTDADQAKELFALAAKKGLYLTEAMWTWYSPVAHKVKAWLESGVLGKLEKAEFHYHADIRHYAPRLTDPNLAGGALLDIGVYPLTYLYRLFGKPEKILCEGRVEDGIDLSEEVSLTYAGGQTFTASISMDNAACGEYLLLTGDRGHVECAGFHAANEAQLVCRNGETEVFEGFGGRRNQFDLVAREIRAGLMESRYIPPAATIAVMEIMDECRRQMNLVYPFERD